MTPELKALHDTLGVVPLTEDDVEALSDMVVANQPWLGDHAPEVLLDEGTSDFPVVLTPGPLAGYVLHIRHDDVPVALARSVQAYAAHALALGELPRDPCPELAPQASRTSADEAGARRLLREGTPEPEEGWFGSAVVGMQLTGPSWQELLLPLLQSDDLWVREEAAHRLGAVADATALDVLDALAARRVDHQDGSAAHRAARQIRAREHGRVSRR